MQNFNAIRPAVRRPFQKNSWGTSPPPPLHGRGLIVELLVSLVLFLSIQCYRAILTFANFSRGCHGSETEWNWTELQFCRLTRLWPADYRCHRVKLFDCQTAEELSDYSRDGSGIQKLQLLVLFVQYSRQRAVSGSP